MILRRARGDHERGSELIELALVLPILLVIIAAIVDFGFLFQRWEVVTNAAREGARVAVLNGYGNTDVTNRVRNYLNAGALNRASAVVTPATTAETLPGSGLVVNTKTVTVTYPSQFVFLAPIIGLVRGSAPATITLRSVSVMRVEGGGGGGS
jgi:Flp pilus assembly protein TadG